MRNQPEGLFIMFNINEKVIYPGHGVAVVEEKLKKLVAGNEINFFKLSFLYKDMTVLIPINNVTRMSIRSLCSAGEVGLVLKELHKTPEKKVLSPDFSPSSWNKRNKDYQLKIQNGNLLDLARIYRDLMFVSKEKDLSFGEKGLLQLVEDLLSQEIGVVTNGKKEDVLRKIRSPFKEYVSFPTSDSRGSQASSSA